MARNTNPPARSALLSDEFFGDLLSQCPATLYTCEADGDYAATYISPAIIALLGWTPEHFLSDAGFWAEQIHSEDRPAVFEGLARLFELGHHTHEYRFQHRDGHYLWMRDELRLLRDASGEPELIVGYWLDISERRAAEDELENLNRHLREEVAEQGLDLRQFFTVAQELLCVANLDGYFQRLSPAWELVLGFTRAELMSRPFVDFVHPEDRESTRHATEGLGQGETVVDFLNRYRTSSGEYRHLAWNATVSLESGMIHATARDVTERREIELALVESETRLRQAQRIGRMGHWTWNIADGSLSWSDEIFRIFGLVPNAFEPTYERFLECVHPEDREAVTSAVGRALEGKCEYSIDHRVVLPDGATRIAHEEGLIERDSKSGEPIRMLGTVHDITAIRAAEERIRLLLDSTAEAIYGIDLEGRCTFANSASARLLGVEPGGQLIGQDMHALTHHTLRDGSPRSREESVLLAILSGGGAVHVEDDLFFRADGTGFEVEYRTRPLLEGGTVVGAVVSFLDVTERRDMERALRQKEEELVRAQRLEAVGHLAGGVAHDFNNLLTVIRGCSDLLNEGLESSHPLRAEVREIIQASERAAALTRQLLVFSRNDLSKPEVIRLDLVVRETEGMLERLIGDHIELIVKPAPESPSILLDRGRLEQVITNLVLNARDAISEAGTIVVSTRRTVGEDADDLRLLGLGLGPFAVLEVCDDGEGMDEEAKAKACDPFFTSKEVGKGTGLGLSIVHGIMRKCGGAIRIVSEPEQGTAVALFFPLVEQPIEEETDANRSADPHEEPDALDGTATILLVEDEESVRVLLTRVLMSAGYTLLVAEDPLTALELARSHPEAIDLLLTDMTMPGMSGAILAERFHHEWPETSCLFITGQTNEDLEGKGEVVLQKPFAPSELLACVSSILALDSDRRPT